MMAITSPDSAGPRREVVETGGAGLTETPPEVRTPLTAIRGAKTVAGDLAAVASGRLALAGLSAASVLITTRMLGPSGYGTLALVSVAAGLIFTASTSWTGISVRRYGREELAETGSMSRLTWNRVIIGVPVAALSIGVILVLKVTHTLSATLTWTLVAIAVGSALVAVVNDHWVCLLETNGRMKTSAAAQVTCQALYVGILVAIFATGARASAATVLILGLGTSTLLAIVVVPLVWRVGLAPARTNAALLRRMLKLSTPMIAFTVSQYLFASIDIIALRLWRSQADVGVYAVAYQAYTVLSRVAVAATAVFVPLFVSLEMAGRRNLINRYLTVNVPQGVFLIAAATGLAIPLLPVVIPLAFGHRFAAAADPLAILCVALAFLYAGYLLSPILTLRERTGSIAWINAGAAAINVALDALLIGALHMGVVAPAVATTAGVGFMFLTFAASSSRALDVTVKVDAFLFAPILGGLAPALALGGLAGAVAGVAGAALACITIIAWRPLVTSDDIALVAKLALPTVIKRWTVKILTVAARAGGAGV